MDIFLKNYWSLYNDFLIKFENLTYAGYSLAYLSHFPSFVTVDSPLWNKLYDVNFYHYIDHRIEHQNEIQEKFNNFVRKHTKNNKNINLSKGKVVIHQDKLMRIPQQTFLNYFDIKQTVILVTADKKTHIKKKVSVTQNPVIDGSLARQKYQVDYQGIYQIPRIPLNKYDTANNIDITKIKKQANMLLESYRNHKVFGTSQFRKWLHEKIEIVMNKIVMSKKFFEENNVSCLLVSTTHSYINRILTIIAAEKGIPTICLQHGIMSSELGYIPKIAMFDAVYGQFEKEWYIKLGVPVSGLRIIGHPRFDQAYLKPKITRQQFYRKLTLASNKKSILLVVRGEKDIEKWRMFIKKLSNKLDLNILMKNYPGNKDHPLVKEFPFVFSTRGMNHYDIFHHVDAVVTYSSTVALEAMLANKHVFILKDDFEGYTNYFAKLGDFVQSDPNALVPYIIKYFIEPDFRKEVENRRIEFLRYAYPNKSLSSLRLKKLIEEVTNK